SDHAVTLLDEEQIHYVHPDCGFWMRERSVADGKMRALVEGRNRFEGRD
ncbi:MAG: methionine synthase, partial [bacterium]|nr:methionine synthase [bacterium]